MANDAAKVTLRLNWGSRPTITSVLAVDLDTKRATVRYKYRDGHRTTETVSFSELEALDEKHRYVPLEPLLRLRALEVIGGPICQSWVRTYSHATGKPA